MSRNVTLRDGLLFDALAARRRVVLKEIRRRSPVLAVPDMFSYL
jgi:hypothetical protein